MNRGDVLKCSLFILAPLIPIALFGCNPLAPFVYQESDPIRAAEFPLVHRHGSKIPKDAVVAVFVIAEPASDKAQPGVEGRLAYSLARKLTELSREQKPKLVLIEPLQVDKFKLKNPNWKQIPGNECAKLLGADFVLAVHVEEMSNFQPGNPGFYEGHAKVSVEVYDVETPNGDPRYTYCLPLSHPVTRPVPVATTPENHFRQNFIESLSDAIARQHLPHRTDGIAEQ